MIDSLMLLLAGGAAGAIFTLVWVSHLINHNTDSED